MPLRVYTPRDIPWYGRYTPREVYPGMGERYTPREVYPGRGELYT